MAELDGATLMLLRKWVQAEVEAGIAAAKGEGDGLEGWRANHLFKELLERVVSAPPAQEGA
jgi:uncharacterized protein YhfF